MGGCLGVSVMGMWIGSEIAGASSDLSDVVIAFSCMAGIVLLVAVISAIGYHSPNNPNKP